MEKRFQIDPKEIFDGQYLFIDGLSRSGKGGIAPIISSFERVEHFNENFNFDRTLPLLETGNLSLEGFKYFMDSDLLIDSWFRLMGRDVNMNKHDISSIANSCRFEEYKKRLEIKDTEEVFKNIEKTIREDNLIFPYMTEEMLALSVHYPEIFEKIKIVVVLRHPIESLFSWHRSKRGSRIGHDKRMPHPTFKVGEEKYIPSYAVNIAERFALESPLGKCALTVLGIYNSYLDSFSKTKIPFITIDFDAFAANPEPEIVKLEKFISTKRTNFTSKALEMARVPRKLNQNLFNIKTAAIFANSNQSLHQEIIDLSRKYEKLFSKCPFSLSLPSAENIQKYKNINFSELTPPPAYVDGYRKN